jgi:alpha-tubulin suppressor-like RCC1 family protein
MVKCSFAAISRLCVTCIVVVAGAAITFQALHEAPASATPSTIGLFTWGDNSTGELGTGMIEGTSLTPAVASLPPGVTPIAIAAGGGSNGGDPEPPMYAAYAIGSDGNLYAWGDNSNGELGTTGITSSATPVVVSLPSGVSATAISAAQGTGYAIGSDGNLYAWGDNAFGKLGDGSTALNSATPVVVSLPAGVTPKAVAGGYESAYAIGSDGHMYAWGDNFYGELGDGSNLNSSTPVVVSLPAGVTPKATAAGGGTGYAMGSDGNLYAWGYNASGQLGDNSTATSSTPVVVQLPSGVTPRAVTGGGGFAHAIGSDGNLYGWGQGAGGQLGFVTSGTPVPVVVSLASGVKPTAISDSLRTGYAVGSDGNLYAWGSGPVGELGNGTTTVDSPPVVVALPPASTPESLAPEPGAVAGYAVVSAPDTAPTVTAQPASHSLVPTESVAFIAGASGFPAPTVQWQVSTDGGATFTVVPGATTDTLAIASVTLGENGNQYEAVFTNPAGSTTTNAATLTVTPAVAPVVTTEPISQSVYAGAPLTMTAAASGYPTPNEQWEVSVDGGSTWISIFGFNSTTVTGMPTLFVNGWQLRAFFSNIAGTATSTAATITVLPDIAPVVTTQPVSQSVAQGDPVTFTAAASGTPTPSVQWQVSVDGGITWIDAAGYTSTTLSGMPIPFVNGWEFRAVFTNGGGSVATDGATLTVT